VWLIIIISDRLSLSVEPATEKAACIGPSAIFAIFFAKNGKFLGSKKCNEKWYYLEEARHPLCSPENYHKRSENSAKF
jgi:hypothetical protein